MTYDIVQVMARLSDNSEHMEFRPVYGPELYAGLIKVDGAIMGIVLRTGHYAERLSGPHIRYWRKVLSSRPH